MVVGLTKPACAADHGLRSAAVASGFWRPGRADLRGRPRSAELLRLGFAVGSAGYLASRT